MRVWFFRAQHAAWWLLSCLALGIFLGTGGLLVVPASTGNAGGIAGRTIVLDAGHGGLDPGAVSAKGGLEKDIVLAIAQELERLLNKAAVSVIMVRHGDYDLADSSEMHLLNRKRQDLERRVFIAEQAQADLYISIHANFFPSPQWSGAQTLANGPMPVPPIPIRCICWFINVTPNGCLPNHSTKGFNTLAKSRAEASASSTVFPRQSPIRTIMLLG